MHFQTARQNNWTQTDEVIERWLNDRQAVLVSFNQVCQLKENAMSPRFRDALKHFCIQLIDYVSAGQFEVFEKIFEASQVDKSPSFDKELLIRLLRTTLFALDFNDQYLEKGDLAGINSALSALGETLATRLEIEDTIIELYVEALKELG